MKKNRIVAIIQARMGSSRLPNKMMLDLHGYPIIEWVYKRVKKARMIDDVILAIPSGERDDVLEKYMRQKDAKVFRGYEKDVLSRFYYASKKYRATHIVRICADNPLICAKEIDNLISYYLSNPCDYAFNHLSQGNLYPDGLGAEIVPFAILEKLYKKAKKNSHREHIFDFIWENKGQFNIKTFDPIDPGIANQNIRVDIDTYKDYELFLTKNININMKAKVLLRISIKHENIRSL